MVSPWVANIIIAAVASSMWIWMQTYVKVQVALHGQSILIPKNRTEPPDLTNDTYGRHAYSNLTNITMHYVTKGCEDVRADRPMLLMLHGFLDFWFIWNRQIATLGEQFCVVAPDLRGYGLTTKPKNPEDYLMTKLIDDLKELIDQLNVIMKRDIVLVGHDWGGMIAFCFATMHEKLLEGLVVINGVHPMAFYKQLYQSEEQIKKSWFIEPFKRPDIPEKYIIMKDFALFDQMHKGFTSDEEEAHKYMFSKNGSLTAALNYYRAFVHDKDQLRKLPYRKINVTTIILWAEKDDFLTKPIAKYNQEWLKTSKIVYYTKAGHWVLRQCPDEVNEHISNFAMDEWQDVVVEERSLTSLGRRHRAPKSKENPCSVFMEGVKKRRRPSFGFLPMYGFIPEFL
ncbi:AB hydrolase superfamily protein YfhM [Rhipicephalus sanguineus]|nr:AB hydrolase superfamily protein YfhM [Rhipicephalus sanguineus]